MISLLMPPATLPLEDEQAFASAAADLRPHVRAVVAAVMRLGHDHPDVDDCTHEALRRAIEGRDRLRAGEPLRPWITGIARHVALDALRALHRQRVRTLLARRDDDGPEPLERIRDDAPSAFDRLATAEKRERVARALAALTDGQRRALTMFHLEGLQYREIAARLGVPLGTVATWVMRARARVAAAAGLAEES
jgi:RNA polymerase sigma-70 factor (ECF subfamily)